MLVVKIEPGEVVNANGVEQVFLAVEGSTCAIYPPQPPHLFPAKQPNAIQWNSVGPHTFKITFQTPTAPLNLPPSPVSTGTTPIIVYPAAMTPYTADTNLLAGDYIYNYTITYDSPPKTCSSYLPSQSAMGIHITK